MAASASEPDPRRRSGRAMDLACSGWMRSWSRRRLTDQQAQAKPQYRSAQRAIKVTEAAFNGHAPAAGSSWGLPHPAALEHPCRPAEDRPVTSGVAASRPDPGDHRRRRRRSTAAARGRTTSRGSGQPGQLRHARIESMSDIWSQAVVCPRRWRRFSFREDGRRQAADGHLR
jgi:hypothetical protein